MQMDVNSINAMNMSYFVKRRLVDGTFDMHSVNACQMFHLLSIHNDKLEIQKKSTILAYDSEVHISYLKKVPHTYAIFKIIRIHTYTHILCYTHTYIL